MKEKVLKIDTKYTTTKLAMRVHLLKQLNVVVVLPFTYCAPLQHGFFWTLSGRVSKRLAM